MKKIKLLLFSLSAAAILISCEKEKTATTDAKNQKNESKLIIQKSGSGTTVADQLPFVINSAGLYQGILYMSVSFTGGQKTHEFIINWDGQIINNGDKKEIDLILSHPYVDDPGTSTVCDSISANILNLGITAEELNDPLLWIKVTNSTNSGNSFFFKSTNEYVDPISITYTRDVMVVKEGCSEYGLWGDLWLVTTDTEPVSHYFVMAMDNTVNYTPVENDQLKVDFNYSYITDSSKVCTQMSTLKALPVKITRIVK